LKKADYHIHTVLSHHAEGSMEDTVRAALAAGLDEMGFSDHLPFPKPRSGPSWNIEPDEYPKYVDEVLRLRKAYPQIAIRLAVEADFFPDCLPRLRELLAQAPLDYVVGSVHYLGMGPGLALHAESKRDWGVDSPEEQGEWANQDVDRVYVEYFRQMRLAAESGLFQVMGHVDLPKKFGQFPRGDLTLEYARTAESFKKAGVVVELNTAGLRKRCKEIYPSPGLLKAFRTQGVPITFGSDAHAPADVAKGFDAAAVLARSAGYEEVHVWKAPGVFGPEKLA
jgi:histidinol-phosphatase (PHP family)